MMSSILNLSKRLIQIDSVSANKAKCKDIIDASKLELHDFHSKEFIKNDVPSLLVYNTAQKPDNFKVLLNAHLDVVPAKPDQFMPFEKDGRLYGRGAYDMKAAAAVEILLFKELANKVKYPLGLQLVTDEEIGGFNGAKYQLEQGVQTEFMLAGEPTDYGIKNESKGVLWAKITTKGTTGHGAYPWQSDNALNKMTAIQNLILQKFPPLTKEKWETTVSMTSIETSNKAQNKIPDDCQLIIDVRSISPDLEKVENLISEIKKQGAGVEFLAQEQPQITPRDNTFVSQLQHIIEKNTGKRSEFIQRPHGSDVRFYQAKGSSAVEFGPTGYGMHTDEEWVDIKSLDMYYGILKDFLLSL